MGELPSGTVSLVFSDMESSTVMVRELGERWAAVLDRQRDLCREAWAAHDGHELGTEGDSFFVVFATAAAAVSAVVAAQRALASEVWPDDVTVRVRMGVHTGTPQRHGDGYVGLDVHRAARVAAAAHGGQVLISQATAVLVEDLAGPGQSLVDVGEHRLKDIPAPMRLFRVVDPGFPDVVLSPRSQGSAGNLPGLRGGFIGRKEELADLTGLISGGARLVTLTGPGGTGKTSLAVAAARELAAQFNDGVFVVDLATVTSGHQMWGEVAQQLAVPADGQVPPGFFDHVANRRVLLVLDNLEQIDDADQMVRMLLDHALHVRVLATSRRPLHVPDEHEYAVTPLPDDDAVALFVEHAQRVRRGFQLDAGNSADVRDLCAALDGLPLAIELAAARTKMFSPTAILARVDQLLDLPSTDRSRVDRQRTVRGAIAWSYDLLPAGHQATLDHLGVFEGGATIEAISAVVPDDVLGGADMTGVLFDLVEASLVNVTDTDDGEPRFDVLQTVQRFALDQLTSRGDLDHACAAHAQYFYELILRLHAREFVAFASCRAECTRELPNLRGVLRRQLPGVVDPTTHQSVHLLEAIVLFAGRALFYDMPLDARLWLEQGDAYTPEHDSDRLAQVTIAAFRSSVASWFDGDPRACVAWSEETWARYESGGPYEGLEPRVPWVNPYAAAGMAAVEAVEALCAEGDVERASLWLERLEGVHPHLTGPALIYLSEAQWCTSKARRDYDEARRFATEQHRTMQEAGFPAPPGKFPTNMAELDLLTGDAVSAHRRIANECEDILADANAYWTLSAALVDACAIGHADPRLAARAWGCLTLTHAVEGIAPYDLGAEGDQLWERIRARLSAEEWTALEESGRSEVLADLMREMAALDLGEAE